MQPWHPFNSQDLVAELAGEALSGPLDIDAVLRGDGGFGYFRENGGYLSVMSSHM